MALILPQEVTTVGVFTSTKFTTKYCLMLLLLGIYTIKASQNLINKKCNIVMLKLTTSGPATGPRIGSYLLWYLKPAG